MKTVRVAGKQYSVLVLGPGEALRPTGVLGQAETVTFIQVLVLEDAVTKVGQGFSIMSPQDRFDSRKGVEIALRRALASVKVDKTRIYPERGVEGGRVWGRRLTAEEKEPFYRLVFGPIGATK